MLVFKVTKMRAPKVSNFGPMNERLLEKSKYFPFLSEAEQRENVGSKTAVALRHP